MSSPQNSSIRSVRANAPRIYVDLPLSKHTSCTLTDNAAKHVQVLRMQPEQEVTLFNGQGGQWNAHITRISKNAVDVYVQNHNAIEREAPIRVTLLIGVPVNERMEFLVEKATELGVAEIYPMMFDRSVMKLSGERAQKKLLQWQSIAISACEQCGRNRLPLIHPVTTLASFLQKEQQALPKERRMLSLNQANAWSPLLLDTQGVCVLSGPEGGLSLQEENNLITQANFHPYSLGQRVLRADTAPLAALTLLTLC